MHFCGGPDDLIYLLMAIPFMGPLIGWLKAKFHHHKHHKDCDK